MNVRTINTPALSLRGGERPALMIIHFLRTFHLLRNPSNYVWSLSFLSHRMSWTTRPRSLISRAAAWRCASDSGVGAGGEPQPPARGPWLIISCSPELHFLTCRRERARPVPTHRCHWKDPMTWGKEVLRPPVSHPWSLFSVRL